MADMTRRSFIEASAIAGAVFATGASIAAAEEAAEEEAVDLEGWVEVAPCVDPVNESDVDMYRMHTPLTTINELRKETIDACEDWVCEDGTVIPAAFVKARMLCDCLGHGFGAGDYTDDHSFDFIMRMMGYDEELAAFFVACPLGVEFNVFDASVANDCTLEEAKAKLDQLAFNGVLFHKKNADTDWYYHQRMYHGWVESSMNLYKNPDDPADDGWAHDLGTGLVGNGDELTWYPDYYPLPVNADVVIDKRILPYDDMEKLLEQHETFAVSACQCRYIANLCGDTYEMLPDPTDHDAVKDYICADGHHLEKCLTFGEEAQFYIDQGIGRQLTRDEMRQFIQRQIDEGCVMQSDYTKATDVICTCDDGCTNMPGYVALGTESPNYPNQSHYNLLYNEELCIHCGMCAQRCPLHALTMSDDGIPEVTGYCFRCGQCAYVCPMEARKLIAKDEALIPELPDTMLDWANKDTMWRYEKGLWPYPMAGRAE